MVVVMMMMIVVMMVGIVVMMVMKVLMLARQDNNVITCFVCNVPSFADLFRFVSILLRSAALHSTLCHSIPFRSVSLQY